MHKKKFLILGASSDIGLALLKQLNAEEYMIGAHCFKGEKRIINFIKKEKLKSTLKIFKKNLNTQKNCHSLVDNFYKWSKGIDALIQLTGNVSKPIAWEELKQKDFNRDIQINLGSALFVSQKVFKLMKKNGGKIILMSTGSAKHGGGSTTLAYGLGKAGIESLTKGIARFGAVYNIMSNALAPGFIETRFHTEKLGRTPSQIKERIKLSKLKRSGKPEEIAFLIKTLISEKVNYITGEIISISGGDWI